MITISTKVPNMQCRVTGRGNKFHQTFLSEKVCNLFLLRIIQATLWNNSRVKGTTEYPIRGHSFKLRVIRSIKKENLTFNVKSGDCLGSKSNKAMHWATFPRVKTLRRTCKCPILLSTSQPLCKRTKTPELMMTLTLTWLLRFQNLIRQWKSNERAMKSILCLDQKCWHPFLIYSSDMPNKYKYNRLNRKQHNSLRAKCYES